MKLHDWTNEQRGRSLWLAGALGITPPVVSDWCTGKKQVPVERCAAIERATQGAVTRRDLRPDDYLDIWPELAHTQALAPPAPEVAGAIAVVVEAVNAVVQDAREQMHKLEVHAQVEIKHAALDMRAEVATAQQASLAAWGGKERRNLPWDGEEQREGEADRRKYEVLGSPDVAADKLAGQGD